MRTFLPLAADGGSLMVRPAQDVKTSSGDGLATLTERIVTASPPDATLNVTRPSWTAAWAETSKLTPRTASRSP